MKRLLGGLRIALQGFVDTPWCSCLLSVMRKLQMLQSQNSCASGVWHTLFPLMGRTGKNADFESMSLLMTKGSSWVLLLATSSCKKASDNLETVLPSTNRHLHQGKINPPTWAWVYRQVDQIARENILQALRVARAPHILCDATAGSLPDIQWQC